MRASSAQHPWLWDARSWMFRSFQMVRYSLVDTDWKGIIDAWGCDDQRLRRESDGRLCPAHRHRPIRPTPQGVGAFAAIERDDRAAVSERVPHRLPYNRGKSCRTPQERSAAFHTSRTAGLALPPRAEEGAHVTANCREPVHTLPQLARRGVVPRAQSDTWSDAHVTAHVPDDHVLVSALHGRREPLHTLPWHARGGAIPAARRSCLFDHLSKFDHFKRTFRPIVLPADDQIAFRRVVSMV